MGQDLGLATLAHEKPLRQGFTFVRCILAVILFAAALLKLQHPAPALAIFSQWFTVYAAQVLLVVTVAMEFFLAGWLASGLAPRGSWACSLGFFLIAAGVALHSTLSGKATCGCFGPVEVHPGIMLTVDLLILGALLMLRPHPPRTMASSDIAQPLVTQHRMSAILGVVMALAGLAFTGFRAPDFISLGSTPTSDQELVILDPETWVGNRLPILANIDAADDLSHGRWLVILVRHDCHVCHDTIEQCESRAATIDSAADIPRIMLVQVPPFGPMENPRPELFSLSRLDQSKEWFVQTPAILLIESGMVQRAGQEALAESWGRAHAE